jgi:maltooligosyltrehalose trehalohydrolase
MTGDRGPLQSAAPGDVLAWEHPLGAHRLDDEHVRFRVWAPRPATLALRAAGGDHPLTPAGGGVHETVLALPAAGPEIDYAYVLDGGEPLPDPCSRWQPQGLRGPSRVLDARALGGRDGSDGFTPPAADELIIYELHIGTFTPEGTFAAAAGHLRELAQLGVTAIEIMPVAEFPGARGWGYDGVYISAAQSSYGGPRELAQLVASAHGAGLAVILDVVYNHVGASGAPALEAFGPYFTAQYETPWGKAINYDDADCGAVREWVCQSAEGWIRDFGIDGLRLDALHAIHDAGAEHIVSAVARRVHAINARAFVIAESGMNDPKVVRPPQRGGWSCDAVWADDFHHALHALITGEQDGYYADFGRVSQLAKAFHRPHVDDGGYSAFRRRRFGAPAEDVAPERFVVFSQNHDQVGNRAYGDRLPDAARPLAAFCTLLAPFTPLLFMGEEYGEQAPFQFFTDHIEEEIAIATREGRRREFAAFARFGDEIPDPEDPATFLRSKLTRRRDPCLNDLYAELIAARRRLPHGRVDRIEYDDEARWLRVVRGDHELVCNFGSAPVILPCAGASIECSTSPGAHLAGGSLTLSAMSAALIR